MFAQSFGMDGVRVTNTGEFTTAIEEALDVDGPTLIEVSLANFS